MNRYAVIGRNEKILGFVHAGTKGMAEVYAHRQYGVTWAYIVQR